MCFDNGALISFQDVVMLEKLCGIKGNACHSPLSILGSSQDGMLTGANLGDVMCLTALLTGRGTEDTFVDPGHHFRVVL